MRSAMTVIATRVNRLDEALASPAPINPNRGKPKCPKIRP